MFSGQCILMLLYIPVQIELLIVKLARIEHSSVGPVYLMTSIDSMLLCITMHLATMHFNVTCCSVCM